jgi:hypothetical protein
MTIRRRAKTPERIRGIYRRNEAQHNRSTRKISLLQALSLVLDQRGVSSRHCRKKICALQAPFAFFDQ